ncbi:MAG: YvcK family protein [Bryobacteraceae bacterium]|nr:YvcK family protein [Bryobacteraceae bacterium]
MVKEHTLSPQAPLRIVAIGGGTGLSTLLRGLKDYTHLPWYESGKRLLPSVEITAVVTVTDDGGSSGRLRREFDVLPPGDIRNCMVALSEDEALLSRLFEYRFPSGRGLKGHSFGNLFLAALTRVTGDFQQAVKFSCEVLAIVGRIYPSTADDVTIQAELADGAIVSGETRISRSKAPIKRISLTNGPCEPLQETLDAIEAADLICLGPGSLFTSVIPNLLVSRVPAAIQSSPALKAYFVNLMWQPGETMRYSAADHVEAIRRHAGRRLVDCAIVNTHSIPAVMRRRYAAQKVEPVENDIQRLEKAGLRVVAENLLAEGEKVRHDPERIAAIAVDLARQGRAARRRGAFKVAAGFSRQE